MKKFITLAAMAVVLSSGSFAQTGQTDTSSMHHKMMKKPMKKPMKKRGDSTSMSSDSSGSMKPMQ